MVLLGPVSAQPAAQQAEFELWLERELWPKAQSTGVSRATFRRAANRLRLDLTLPGLTGGNNRRHGQAEFRAPGAYFDQRSIGALVGQGRNRMRTWRTTLAAIEAEYGVPRTIVVAIWGRESGFGRATMPKNAIRSLATLAFLGRRAEFFEQELLAVLRIAERGDVALERLGSSWAGALGQPQLLPSKYERYAVDFDRDGRRDIWHSVPDSLASIAHYLAEHGWQSGRDWGYEAAIPNPLSCTLGGPQQGRTIAQWVAAGLKRISARPFPARELEGTGYLLFPAGRHGPVFVTTPNFYVLKQYNESDLYALFVGHLADRLSGNGPFRTAWRKLPSFERAEVKRMQQALIARGYDVGGADGLIGYKTRTAVGLWQEHNGRPATCFPDRELINLIR